MHAYCHGNTCRLQFDPRGVEGQGRNGDGESIERFWSFIVGGVNRLENCGSGEAKRSITATSRSVAEAKVKGLALWLNNKVCNSGKALPEHAFRLLDVIAELTTDECEGLPIGVRAARRALTGQAASLLQYVWPPCQAPLIQCMRATALPNKRVRTLPRM